MLKQRLYELYAQNFVVYKVVWSIITLKKRLYKVVYKVVWSIITLKKGFIK